MNFLQKSQQQIKIWNGYRLLRSSIETERRLGAAMLKGLAPASLPCLRACLNPHAAPRTQYAAAVALHQIGESDGIEMLSDALIHYLPLASSVSNDLINAWIAVGEPDAIPALLKIWNKTTDWSDKNPTLICICHIWTKLRNPAVLDALANTATRIPELFLKTIAPFGEAALPALEAMTKSPEPYPRILAVKALKKIVGVRSLNLLVPLLRDEYPAVRSKVPSALIKTGWPAESIRQIGLAIEAGFCSPEAIGLMEIRGPVNYPALVGLVTQWNPATYQRPGITEPCVFAALRVLHQGPADDETILPALRELLARPISAPLLAEAARLTGMAALRHSGETAAVIAALLPLLAHADDTVRGSAARSLSALGEGLGAELEQWLAENRPQDSLLTKFQAMLTGGTDAEQAADIALKHVGNWITRVTRETAGRFNGGGLSPDIGNIHDTRLPGLLRDLLSNALAALEHACKPEETAERLSLCIACLRAAPALGKNAAIILHETLLRAFHCVVFGPEGGKATGGAMRLGDVREVGRMVRKEAGMTLLQIYRGAVFPLYLEALFSPVPDVCITGISALGRLGDARALNYLARFAESPNGRVRFTADEAAAAIRGANPEIMTLLRASSAVSDPRPETLLRPAQGGGNTTPPDQLLRPAPSD